jgi:hypothetical protein
MKHEKVEKGLNVMDGHGWGSHGGTWKMGRWGQNIAFETLDISMGYVLRPHVET